ncbi:ribose-5-phosphate isomerase [Heterostelium album PN500]|uniref:ribose-5-phosphate isomerase n=1 Tax=Heterostelium pallidum (strain ATCC 26659 / Pp 5 / PN500) TaxID=670386 RepID=D3BKB6_HETP5|nr:ribose-5-phosphate isomerase [Heterostelium album PN500]EFA78346.1 ribose-5-phosphate isomerase [Heterostelium album PN500]|eukprot:XP_020430471.1 ribose-5-phosphate isomerase [Heterostelium album PN500]
MFKLGVVHLGLRNLNFTTKTATNVKCYTVSSVKMDKEILEKAKKLAGYKAVDDNLKSGLRVGIGSGSTIKYVVDRIKELGLDVICVPTSFQSTQLIVNAGLTLSDLSRTPELDITIDGADEVDSQLNCIKGGGACQLQEKIVAAASKRLVIVADFTKDSQAFGQQWKRGIPIEVVPMAYVPVMNKLSSMSLKPVLRMAVNKAGPVVSDNANFIIDAQFESISNVAELATKIKMIPGVVETGLFVNMASRAYFGQQDGTVKERTI